MKTAGVLLVGGESRRMGFPKSEIIGPDGRTVRQHLEDLLQSCCDVVICAGMPGSTPGDKDCPNPFIPDLRPGEGPLAGIEAVLRSNRAVQYLVLACDQFLVQQDDLQSLLTASASIEGNRPIGYKNVVADYAHPFPSLWPASLSDKVTKFLDSGERSVMKFLRSVEAKFIDPKRETEDRLVNCNTPEDLPEGYRIS